MRGSRKAGKQEVRWDDEITKFMGYNLYHRVTYDRREWTRLGEAFVLKELYML